MNLTVTGLGESQSCTSVNQGQGLVAGFALPRPPDNGNVGVQVGVPDTAWCVGCCMILCCMPLDTECDQRIGSLLMYKSLRGSMQW
jgi:hypothetical protein